MKFPFKKVGDTLSVDEYNALCYLLSKQDYSEDIVLEFRAKHYKYGVYKLTDSTYSLITKDNGFIIRKANNPIKITFAHQNPNANFYIELKVARQKEITENGITTTLYPYDVIDTIEDNVMDSKYEITYETIKLKAEPQDTYTDVVTFNPQEYQLLPNDFISSDARMIMAYDEPILNYTDGRELDPNQILCEDFNDIQRAIISTPPNSVVNLRLKGSEAYDFPNHLNIDNGKKIFIEGGNPYSNSRSELTTQGTNRMFIVHPNSTLSVKNCQFTNGNATHYPVYRTGGAITMSSSYENLGEYNGLNVPFVYLDTCKFLNCTAERGGAIYNHMGRLDINNCEFNHCIATSNTNPQGAFGGAIMTTSVPVYNGASNQLSIDKSKYEYGIEGIYYSRIHLKISPTQNLNYFTDSEFTINQIAVIYDTYRITAGVQKIGDDQYSYILRLPTFLKVGDTFYLIIKGLEDQPSLCSRLLKVTGNRDTQMYVEMV